MIQVPDEMLMAYADGELTVEETQALEQVMRQDPVLRTRLEPFVQTRMRLSYAFDRVLHEPVPDRLVAAIAAATVRQQPAPPSIAARVSERVRDAMTDFFDAAFPNGFTAPVAASIAAMLVVGGATGLLAGRFIGPSPMVAMKGGGMVASGTLAYALETLPSLSTSASGSDGSRVTPTLSFQSAKDGVCRQYHIAVAAETPDYAGLACRAPDGAWHIALQTETVKLASAAGQYTTQNAPVVRAIADLMESRIEGETFGVADESARLANDWQPPAPPHN
ncbi:MAG: hypothetical protein AB7S70_17755 [Hyphomicrobium sp.]